MKYQARAGYKVEVAGEFVSLYKPNKNISFRRSDISEVTLTNSSYDLPFFESTVVIRLQNGKKYKVKRLRRKHAKMLAAQLNQ